MLFGGYGPGCGYPCSLSDTWTWNGSNWTLRTPSVIPHERSGHAMAWDGGAGGVLMYGCSGAENFDTCLERQCLEVPVTYSKPKAPGGSGKWSRDSYRKEVIMFGGWDLSSRPSIDETWIWKGQPPNTITPMTSTIDQ